MKPVQTSRHQKKKQRRNSLNTGDEYRLHFLPKRHVHWKNTSSTTLSYISNMIEYQTNVLLTDKSYQDDECVTLLKKLQERIIMKIKGTKAPSPLFDYNLASATMSSLDDSVSNLKNKISYLYDALDSEKQKVKKLKKTMKSGALE